MAKSWGRAESSSLRTLPALPAPPDDALLPPLFICGFRPSPRLCTLFSGCWGVGGSGGRPRGGLEGRAVGGSSRAPAVSAPGAQQGPRRLSGPEPSGQLPAPSPGLLPPRPHFKQPGQRRRERDRQTERPPPSPSAPTPLARTQRKERRRGCSGGCFGRGGLDSSCHGALRGQVTDWARGAWTRERDPGVLGRPLGARAEQAAVRSGVLGFEGDGEGAWRRW